MVEAVRTTASPAGIWVIVVVATGLLAFWLTAIALADRSQVRASGGFRAAREAELGPAPAVAEAAGAEPVPPGDILTRVDLPAQRAGDADRAERSYAGPGAPGDEETDQS